MGDRPRTERRTAGAATKRMGLFRRRRRLEVDDVLVVEPSRIRTAVGGTVVGNFMEWFDFGVYGYMAITLANLFFDTGSETLDLLLSLLGFAVSFLVRPLGGLVLGPLGDKIGRQKVLFFTMAAMAIATALIGVLPTAADIGVVAAFLLYALKMIQGFSTGGEYAGATTFITEYAPDKRRGFYSSLLDMGSYLGFAVGAAFVSILQVTLPDEPMDGFGWRIPFLVALPLGLIAMWFRSHIEDTPAFKEAKALAEKEQAVEEAVEGAAQPKGLRMLIATYWRELLVGFLLVSAANTCGYALTSYMPTYLTGTLGYDEVHGNLLTLPVLVIMSLCIPLTGLLSDKIGRRAVLFIGSVSAIVLAVPAFLLMMHGAVWSVLTGLFLLAIPVAFYVANLASSLPALFHTSSRYGGMGISYNLAVAIFGGAAPLIMEALVAATKNSLVPAFWIIGTSVAGFIAVVFLRESARRPLMGSMPAVATPEEAHELVKTQDTNPDLHLDLLFEPAPTPGEGVRMVGVGAGN